MRGLAATIINLRSKVDGCSGEMVYVKQQGAQCGASGMKRRAMVGIPLCSGASRGGFGTPHTRVAESQHLVARHTLKACSARLIDPSRIPGYPSFNYVEDAASLGKAFDS